MWPIELMSEFKNSAGLTFSVVLTLVTIVVNCVNFMYLFLDAIVGLWMKLISQIYVLVARKWLEISELDWCHEYCFTFLPDLI